MNYLSVTVVLVVMIDQKILIVQKLQIRRKLNEL